DNLFAGRSREGCIPWIGQMLRDVENRLLLIVEGTLDNECARIAQTQTLFGKLKTTSDGECGRCQYNGVNSIEQLVLEYGRHIDRRRLQHHSPGPPLDPVDERLLRALHPELQTFEIFLGPAMQWDKL